MRTIAFHLSAAFRELFPKGRHSWVMVGMVLLAAIIPVSELLVAKIFSTMIIHISTYTQWQIVLHVLAFVGLFGVTRTAHYLQKTYKVNVFDKAFRASGTARSKMKESWEWALAFELTTILSALTNLVVFLAFFTFLNWQYGILNFIVLLASLQVMGMLFKRQMVKQVDVVAKRKAKEHVEAAERVGARVKSGEIGTLFSSGGLVILLGAMVVLAMNGMIDPSSAIVLFLGSRMQNSTLSQISAGLMRFARASANNIQ
jgi:MFS family permease